MSAIYFIANYTIYAKLDFDKKGLIMPHNILMSKIRCYNPNKSHSALKNLNYIIYIGTRPGVDLTDVQLDEITALTEEDIIPEGPSANSQYIYYIAKRQNSQGLFGNFEFNNITEVAHEVRNVTDAGVNVYRGIVSLSEEDALELGYNKKENWVNYMNSVMNDVGDRFGIPLTSLKWCAAVHMEHGHPHCHYTFWRTDGKVMSSYIHVSKQNEIREFLSKEMFKAEREMLISEKNKYRDATVDAAHTFMNNLDMDFNHIPERITRQQLMPLSTDLIELVNSLPGKGSLKYKLLPPECKLLVNKVVDDVIQIPAVNKEYTSYIKTISDISITYSASTNHHTTNQSIADEDIRTRLANSILKSAATLSLIQKKNLSGELSSPQLFISDNEFSQMNSVHLNDEESSQMNSAHPNDDEFPQVNSVHLNDDEFSQVNSVHLNDDEFPQVNSVHLNDDELSQVNSVHLNDDEFPQVNSVHLINDRILNDIPCAKLEWTKGFKNTRKELYSLDKNDPDYLKKFNRVLDELITYHNQGNLPATYLLARLYSSKAYPVYNSEISAMLYTLSYNNFKDIYNNQNTPFLHGYLSYHLGKMSERGLGCEVNYNDAVAYYKNCLNDNVYAQYALANIYLNEKATPLTPELYMTALDLLKHASAENPYAAYQYAQHLENPLYDNVKLSDATQDGIYHYYNIALTGFLKEQDSDSNLDGSILYKIGKIYYEGKGCEKDDEKAYEYFMKAADCKNKNAYYALGKTCSDKTSTHYDIIRAEQYYLKAYEEYYDSETGESHAPSYLKKSMADLYANQEHGIYDINKAISLYKDCAENDNDTFSMFKLGSIYLNGNGVYKDITLGLHYLNDAADCGNKFAKVTLADFYADATHNHYNIAKAISLYKDCIKNDADSYSMSKLGSIYLFGNGVPKDEALGLKYLNDAAAQGNEYAQKTIYFYNNMKHSMAVSASFSLAYHFLNSLSDRRNQEHLLRIHSKSTSKEARIDAYKKNKEHSSADFEHE